MFCVIKDIVLFQKTFQVLQKVDIKRIGTANRQRQPMAEKIMFFCHFPEFSAKGTTHVHPVFRGDFPEIHRAVLIQLQGVIQKIDFAMNQMVVSGNRYDVSTSARVSINGTYGAFTMLTTGMRIEFTYKKFSDGVRQIIEVRELSDSEDMEEA